MRSLFRGGEGGIRPAALGQCRRPARGTKKPFTGWFFSRHRRAVPFSSLLLLCSTKKRPQMRSLFRGGEGGIRTLAPVTPAYSLSRGAPSATWVLLHGYIAGVMLNYMAEREGFEPPVPCGITGFQDQLHKPLGHLSIFKLYNYSKGFSHCQAGRFSKKWLKPFLRVFSDFASRVRSRAAKPAKYENLWFSSVLPHMSSKPE